MILKITRQVLTSKMCCCSVCGPCSERHVKKHGRCNEATGQDGVDALRGQRGAQGRQRKGAAIGGAKMNWKLLRFSKFVFVAQLLIYFALFRCC